MKNLSLKVKNTLLSCLFILMVACICATSILGFTAFAEDKPIKMRGASVRISSTVPGEYGLRFGTLIEKDYLDNLEKASDFEVGMLYIPTDLVNGELTVNTATVGKMILTNNAVAEKIDNVNYYAYNGYIKNMPASEYDRQISARSYILNNGVYTYADVISRSAIEVARAEHTKVAENQEVIEQLYFNPYVSAKITHEGGSTTLNSDNTLQVSIPHFASTGIHVAKTLDTYKPGTYVMTEFVGANMIPTIFFGVGETGTLRGIAANDYHNIGLTGVGIFAGVQNASTKYVYRATSTETATSVGLMNFYNYGYLVTKNKAYGDASLTACDKTYVLIIGADNVAGGVNVEHMLFEKNTETNELTLVESVTKLVEGATLNRGSILFGSATNLGINANFKLYLPETKKAIIEKLAEVYNYNIPTISSSDFVTSASASVTVSDNGTTNTKADDYYNVSTPFISAANHNYAYTSKTYAPGTYALTEFVGGNFPSYIIFGSDEVTTGEIKTNNNKYEFAASGVGICGDDGGSSRYWYKDTATNEINAKHAGFTNGNFRRGYFLSDATNKAKTFVMLAGVNNVGSNAVVEYTLFEKNTTTGELTPIQTISATITGVNVKTGRIVFASSVNANYESKFKLYTPDTKENLIDLMADVYGYDEISSANVEFSSGAHTITDLETGKVNITMTYNTTKHQYAKTLIDYNPGTYALLEFNGNGAPRNIFFGNTSISEAAPNNYYATAISGFGLTADSNWGTEGYAYINGTLVKATTSGETGKFDRGYLVASNSGAFKDIPTDAAVVTAWQNRNYVMLVGAVQDGANVKIEYTLWLNDNGTLTEIQTKEFVFANQTLETGSIVFTPSVKTGHAANFKLYTPDTKANLIAKMDELYN